jgi:multidrug efflux pump subunit AcrA (membrane-fusion protein)
MKLVTKGLIGYGAFCLVTAGIVASIPAIERGQCTAGDQAACDRVEARDKRIADRQADREAALVKAQAQKAEEAQRKAAAKAEKEAAEAKLQAEGWWEQQPGIFVRWCTDTCSRSKVIGDNTYSLMEVWAKDAHAGDIYAQVNLLRNGVVVGWTNDTMYLSRGQRGVLTFDSYIDADSMSLVKFRARG